VKKTYKLGEREIPGEEIEFEVEREEWSTYILHDGTKLKLKPVTTKIVRLDVYNAEREPVYLINSTNVLSANVPDSLKKQDG
jgi:hypothetical protein